MVQPKIYLYGEKHLCVWGQNKFILYIDPGGLDVKKIKYPKEGGTEIAEICHGWASVFPPTVGRGEGVSRCPRGSAPGG